MMRALGTALLWLFSIFGPLIASAQESPESVQLSTDLVSALSSAVDPTVLSDYDEWEEVARTVETLLDTENPSDFRLTETREELSLWRDRFLLKENADSPRINTLSDQIVSLGPVPEDGNEDPRITRRRVELLALLQTQRVPFVLASEARSRAGGLISEIDQILRERQTNELTSRSPSPLLPAQWAPGISAFAASINAISEEVSAAASSQVRRSIMVSALPGAVLLFLLGVFLVARAPRLVIGANTLTRYKEPRQRAAFRNLLNWGALLLPLIGVWALSQSVEALNIFSFRGRNFWSDVPWAASYVVLSHWLAAQIKPALDQHNRHHGVFLIKALGWVMATRLLLATLIPLNGASGAAAVVYFPLFLLAAFLLYRLAEVLRRRATSLSALAVQEKQSAESPRALPFGLQLQLLAYRAIVIIAIAAPLLAAAGFVFAADAILFPTLQTLALLGMIIALQRLVQDIYTILTGTNERASDALLPVLIGFAISILALPVLALIWGARETDLTELWARIREGFTIGETQISPTDFLVFAIVFVALYLGTRLLQGALRNSVLPKTNLDLGGQNAISSGVGYVGIFLAALIAIRTAGIDLSGLAIVAGALSVGIGFGLQNIVSNFVSGIILLIERPVAEGDWIEVGGKSGYVRQISVRSTRLETFDRADVIIPNSDLVATQVVNMTKDNSVGRLIVPVGVAYKSDPQKVSAILEEIARAHPMVLLAPPPSVVFVGFGADSLNFEIRAILRDVNWILATQSDMNHEIAKRFAEADIEIPFAQRDIWLRNPEVLRDAVENSEI